jgi:hypothetical protein
VGHAGGIALSAGCRGISNDFYLIGRIDQLVAPGTTINPDENSYGEAELTPAALRRTR